jgi:uncharacterized protein YeaO (DUF488 family)
LAIRGHSDPRGPTIGEVADYLLLLHHSAVGLVDRADAAGLVIRTRDDDDRRVVRLRLTADGAERLEALSALHLEEIKRLAPQLPGSWEGLAPVQGTHGFAGSRTVPPAPRARSPKLSVARVYDEVGQDPRRGVLVDRLWPRGLARDDAPFKTWAKEVAPSPQLRKWYGHVGERFDEFARRYRDELAAAPTHDALEELQARIARTKTVLLTATKDLEHSHAIVLRDVLVGG